METIVIGQNKPFILSIIGDVHLGSSKSGRISYYDESKSTIYKVLELNEEVRRETNIEDMYLLLCGDIVDISERKINGFILVQQLIKILINDYKDCFLNFGNHEITYHKYNPLYTFMGEINNNTVKAIYPFLKCHSNLNEIKTPERILTTDTEIILQAYGCSHRITKDLKNKILVSHENIVSKNIKADLDTSNKQYYIDYYDLLLGSFTHVFNGHIHAVDISEKDGAKLYNTGSLIPTSIDQINDYINKKFISYLIFDANGCLEKIVLKWYKYHLYKDIVQFGYEDKLEKQRQYREVKELQRSAYSANILKLDDPVTASGDIIKELSKEHNIIFDKLKRGISL